MRIELPYGHERRTIDIDEKRLIGVFSPEDVEAVKDVKGEVIRSLENPIGLGGLRSIVRPGRKVAMW